MLSFCLFYTPTFSCSTEFQGKVHNKSGPPNLYLTGNALPATQYYVAAETFEISKHLPVSYKKT